MGSGELELPFGFLDLSLTVGLPVTVVPSQVLWKANSLQVWQTGIPFSFLNPWKFYLVSPLRCLHHVWLQWNEWGVVMGSKICQWSRSESHLKGERHSQVHSARAVPHQFSSMEVLIPCVLWVWSPPAMSSCSGLALQALNQGRPSNATFECLPVTHLLCVSLSDSRIGHDFVTAVLLILKSYSFKEKISLQLHSCAAWHREFCPAHIRI